MTKERPTRPSLEPARVLLVEDDPGDVLITRESFADSSVSCELSVVSDGAKALDFLHKRGKYKDAQTPHLVLLDLNLPKVSGREVLAEVKGNAELSTIPVIVLSTSTAEADISHSYKLHANAYITKPVDYDDFHEVVKSINEFFLTIVRLPSQPA